MTRVNIKLADGIKAQRNILHDYAYCELHNRYIVFAYSFVATEYIDETDKKLGEKEFHNIVSNCIERKKISGVQVHYRCNDDVWTVSLAGDGNLFEMNVDTEAYARDLYKTFIEYIFPTTRWQKIRNALKSNREI